LTTLYLVYILFDNTKYRYFVLYLIFKGLLIRVWRKKEKYALIHTKFLDLH